MTPSLEASGSPDRVHGIVGRQGLIAVALGLGAWFAAATLVRVSQPLLAAGGWREAPLYAAVAAATWLGLWLARRAGATRDSLVRTIAIATGAAAFCDVIAMSFFPTLYANTPAGVLAGAVIILWGVGCALIFAFI
jgi:hypothetical protein